MSAVLLAVTLVGVLGTVVGVLLCLTGVALAFLGVCSAMEGTGKRGLGGLVVGVALFAAGLLLTGFL